MSAKSDVAVAKFLSGYNCAQSVLYAFCDELGLETDTALKMACGFGAGMGRKQEVCGAVTGGILALSLKHGRGENQDRTRTEETYRKVHQLMSGFEARHGSCLCRSLLEGCDLSTPGGQRLFKDHDLQNKTCKGCVQTVVDIVEEII